MKAEVVDYGLEASIVAYVCSSYVGGTSAQVKASFCSAKGDIELAAAVARVHYNRLPEGLPDGFEHVAAEQFYVVERCGVGRVVDAKALCRGALREFRKTEVWCNLIVVHSL